MKLFCNWYLPVGCELTLAGDSLAVDDATICVWLDATVLDWDCDRDELVAVWCGGVDCCDCECNCDWFSGICCCCCETSWLICWWWCNKGGLCDRSGVPDPVWISSYTKAYSNNNNNTRKKNQQQFFGKKTTKGRFWIGFDMCRKKSIKPYVVIELKFFSILLISITHKIRLNFYHNNHII